ncbi:MAG: TlpA family protein disulfide reductase [Lachnospiraceae bacterium]
MRNIRLLAIGVLAGMMLTGCGAQDKEPQDTAQTAVQTETHTEPAEEAAEQTEGLAQTEMQTEPAAEMTEQDAEGAKAASSGLFGTFEAQTLDGETVTQDIFAQAELTMVNIWGTFCGPCISEMPELGELSREYADKGMQLIGIVSDATDPDNETAHLIIEETKADYQHLVVSESLYYNYLMNVQAVPTTVFVDKQGNQVGEIYTGARSKADWAAIADELLEEAAQ